MVILSRALGCQEDGVEVSTVSDHSPLSSPLFWAVDLFPEDVERWKDIHDSLRQMTKEHFASYPDVADAPIRYSSTPGRRLIATNYLKVSADCVNI